LNARTRLVEVGADTDNSGTGVGQLGLQRRECLHGFRASPGGFRRRRGGGWLSGGVGGEGQRRVGAYPVGVSPIRAAAATTAAYSCVLNDGAIRRRRPGNR
jgi:hypothetical protein